MLRRFPIRERIMTVVCVDRDGYTLHGYDDQPLGSARKAVTTDLVVDYSITGASRHESMKKRGND